MKTNLNPFFIWYFCALCPFISLIRMPMDIQPWAIIVSAIIILKQKEIAVNRTIIYILFTMFIATFFLILSLFKNETGLFLIFRKYMNYISLGVIVIAGYNIFLQSKEINESWIKIIILLWLVAGVLELIFPASAKIIMPGSRTSSGRGVVGLAMEPSFYGYMCFFFMLLSTKFKTKKRLYMVLCIVQILLLAKSAVSIIYLAIYAISCILEAILSWWKHSKFEFKRILMTGISGIIVLSLTGKNFIEKFSNTRMINVFKKLFNSIGTINGMSELYKIDYSVAERLDSIVSSINIFINRYGVPYGFDYQGIGLSGTKRIMSGFGATICELGVIGLILVVIVFIDVLKGYNWKISVCVLGAMFSAVQLSSPTFAFVLAASLFYLNETANKSKSNIVCVEKVE